MESRKELKLYQELKNISLPSSEDNLDDLLIKKDIYDINPNTNFEIMKKYIVKFEEQNIKQDDLDDQFKNFYLNNNQTLTYKQKVQIINKIKSNNKGELIKNIIGFNEKSNMENYFDILKLFFKKEHSMEDFSNIKKLFYTQYYIEIKSNKIPLIYGTNELKYGGLIYNLYQKLFYDNYINDCSDNQNIELKEDEYGNIVYKIKFIYNYLEKIFNEEFYEFFNINEQFQLDESKNFEKDYNLNPEIDSLFFHLLYFDLIFSIYCLYGGSDYLYKYENIFFENKRDKFFYLSMLNDIFKFKKCENNQIIEFKALNDIQNTDYLLIDLKNEKNTLKFNPYDYSFSNLRNNHIKTFEDAKKAFNNPNNFSLNLIYKKKRLFNDENLFKLFNEDIKNILSSNVINDLYYQNENFKEFFNPYKKEEFIKQIFDIILYVPIPFKKIEGFTNKNFGLIFLNNIELNNRYDSTITSFCKYISYISF